MHTSGEVRFPILQLVTVILGILGGGVAGGFAASLAAPVISTPITLTNKQELSVVDAIRKVAPSVVSIANWGEPRPGMPGYTVPTIAFGSGFVIDQSGLIVTNDHVVQRAQVLQVSFSDGTIAEGTVVDTNSESDIAIIKVKGPLPAAVSLGNSNELQTGQTVIAIGNPLYQFRGTVTVGVVSGLHRTVGGMNGLIQTDAAINSGNSGGPLIDAFGEVIGINTLVVQNSPDGMALSGLGFAIPSNQAREAVAQSVSKISHGLPYFGAVYQEVDDNVQSVFSLQMLAGVMVTQIETGSPAAQAGLQESDVILEIDGQKIDRGHLFPNVLATHKPGDTVTMIILRAGRQSQIKVPLGHRAY